jgi:hypothetical protein
MKNYSVLDFRVILVFAVVAASLGCASVDKARLPESSLRSFASSERIVVRSGDLVISVESLDETSLEVERLVKESGGGRFRPRASG